MKAIFHIHLFLLAILISITACAPSPQPQQALADNGMVVSAHPAASKIGIEILKQGGNAIDAAVATGFALAVCYPAAGNLGGGGFMLIRLADGKSITLDFREIAPEKANRDMFLDINGNVVDDQSLYSHRAAGVPGSVDGLITAHEKYGVLPFEKVIQPAIDLAIKGFPITQKQAANFNHYESIFLKLNKQPPVFVMDTLWEAGDFLIQNDLAHTLQLIQNEGRAGFYQGETAEKIIAQMQRNGGLISYSDLENYRPVWRQPIEGDYKNYHIISMPPPSSGGIGLLQLLQMVENYPVKKWGVNSAKTVHLFAEAERRMYADRAYYLGDPDFVDIPVEKLLSAEYNTQRMQTFDENRATPSENIQHGKTTWWESEETTHYSIVDKAGNAVAVTTTLNRSYGARIVVEGAGFLLNNEMDDFSIKPGFPNSYGLVGGTANAIEPQKRMLSSMTPTIVEKDGKLFMVVGTPGGSTIITSVFQTIINVIEHSMNMQQAVSSQRFHHQWKPDIIYYEDSTFTEETMNTLRQLGHTLRQRSPIGRVDAILVRPDNCLEAGADPRGDDTAEGY